MPHLPKRPSLSAAKTLLLAGLAAGTLDLLTAIIVYGPILHKVEPMRLLQGITSAIIGRSSFQGGALTAFTGVLIHYCIAFTWTTVYIAMYPRLPALKKWPLPAGLLYGLLVWIIMNTAILPLIGYIPFKYSLVPAIRGAVILMFAIGLPIALITAHYYRSAAKTPVMP